MKNRLLILSASIGAGHHQAGEALCQSYNGQFGGEAFHVDFLRYVSPLFSRFVERSYYLVTKHTPSVYKLLYQMEERPHSPVKKLEVYIGLRKYRELIDEYKPDAIIATHFLPAAIVSYMYHEFPIPNGVVLTDYVSHSMWIYPHNQLFFVAHEGMREELKMQGVVDSRIRVSGIPISPSFSGEYNRRILKEKFQLNPDQPVILIMSGGNAIGPLQEVIGELTSLKDRGQLVVIAGHNREAYHELKKVMAEAGLAGQVKGFINNMHEWMAASDLLISKAGGLTVTEAMASGLPMLIVRPTPGQEVGNTNLLCGHGAAIHMKDISELGPTVTDLFDNPQKLKTMGEKAGNLSKPCAAKEILAEMNSLIEENEVVVTETVISS